MEEEKYLRSIVKKGFWHLFLTKGMIIAIITAVFFSIFILIVQRDNFDNFVVDPFSVQYFAYCIIAGLIVGFLGCLAVYLSAKFKLKSKNK